MAVIAAGDAWGAPVLPPPAPETSIQPAPGAPVPNEPPGDDSHDVLTRGPVHEAFAEQYNADPAEGLVITKAPPEPIDEVPPETMPEGNNIQWIPGYWGWDDEREDFIWISGLWRDIPPGQRWVPGYWNQADAGYQWVSGFWTGAENAELAYQPQPPATLEQGPNVAAPSDDQFWVPGVWTYVDTGYRWRPGYWAPAYDDWVWVPDRWVWTPYGFVFLAGYYDYRMPVRAVAFAPIYFSHVHWWHYHRRPFCPSVVLDCGPLTMHWFVRPNYCHYYFGDYYADTYYTGWGLQPWYTCSFGFGGYGGWRNRHCHYDPLFVHYSGYHRRHHNVDFGDRMHQWHNHYMAHADDRPRWTKRDQDNFDDMMRKANRERGDGKQARIGRDYNDFVANPSDHDQKFVKLDGKQRDRHTKTAQETTQLAVMRHDLETDGGKIRGVRGDGKGRGSDASIALPGAGNGTGSGQAGNNGRQSRKLKLPTDQGAGDQAIVTKEGNREPNRHARRDKLPDGPPGGNNPVVGHETGNGNKNSGGRNGRRGGGSELTDNVSGQDGDSKPGSENNGRGRGNDSGSGGRGSRNKPGGDNPPGATGGNGQNSGTGGSAIGNSSSRDRNRGKGGNNGNQNLNPVDGNPSGGSGSGKNGNSGSNRNPRRGNSGGVNNGSNGGSSNTQIQPLPGQGGGNGSSGGRSRSRGGSGSFDSNPNGGGSSGGNAGGGSSGGGDNGQRRSGGNNRGNDGPGSGSTEQGSDKKPNAGSFGPSGGSSRGRGQGNSSGGGKKKKD